MAQWDVVLVITSLVGLFLTVGVPIIGLNKTITTLNIRLDHMEKETNEQKNDIDEIRVASKESHRRIWEHNTSQDKRIDDHEKRITILEHK